MVSRIEKNKNKKGRFYTVHTIEKSLRHHVLEWVATAGSLTGVFMVASQIRNGFMIWMLANILWIGFAYHHRHWGLLFLSTCYLFINLYGFIQWGLV